MNDLKDVTIEHIKREEINEGEIGLKVELCGLCGSDIKTYTRGTPYVTPPAVLGHEVVGTVIKSKHPKWEVGDRVAVAHYVPCGSCHYCMQGKGTLCPNLFENKIMPGGFSEYIRIPKPLADRGTFKLSNDTSFNQAVLAEPLACCIHAVREANIPVGSTVLIIGDGPMGLLNAQVAKIFGANKVILSGMNEQRLNKAKQYADITLDANKVNVGDEVKKLTNGFGPQVVIVAVAIPTVAEEAMSIVSAGGTVLLFGGFPHDSKMTLNPNKIHYDEVKLIGSVGSLPEDFYLALTLLENDIVISEDLFTS